MSNVNQKYLKDENDKIFSPITSSGVSDTSKIEGTIHLLNNVARNIFRSFYITDSSSSRGSIGFYICNLSQPAGYTNYFY